nr:hypothetical protein [Allonocardiopsis opalescens]
MLRAARSLLAIRSPLEAELVVSKLLGSWWGNRLISGDAEQLFGEGLVGHAARAGTPAALALLTGIASLGTVRQSAAAEHAALRLIRDGVPRPGWAESLGAVEAHECHVSRTLYGDSDELICTFSYRGEAAHALIAVIDYNSGGMLRDAWVTSKLDRLFAHVRAQAASDPMARFEPMDPVRARGLLEEALAETNAAAVPKVSEGFAGYHALVRSRIRALPPNRRRRPLHPVYGRDRRATLAARFLASAEAAELSDSYTAGRCVDQIIDYGCDADFGRPLRISPVKTELFLLTWLPRKVILTPAEQEAMPHVLAAWTRWAGRVGELPAEAIRAVLDTLWESTEPFSAAYRDPASYGVDWSVLPRLLPDGDLEALPRRMFAFPLLTGVHGDLDLDELDPCEPADRRRLLRLDHMDLPEPPAPGADAAAEGAAAEAERHLDRHDELATRLWDGDPPQLWEAAERLLDQGEQRLDVLHRLIDALTAAAGDDAALVRALDEL